MITIGITGTIGAGKGETVSYLERKGFKHYSVRSFLEKELKKKGMPIRRDTMTDLADQLRKEHSPEYIIQQIYEEARAIGKDCVIESIRALGEVDFLKKQGNFFLIAVDALLKIRYDRIIKRKSALDHVTFSQFEKDNDREMASNEPSRGNITSCIGRADFIIQNDGTIMELRKKIGKVLKEI